MDVVRIVETKEMEANKIVFLDASQMDEAITATGSVSLYGILFDFDKDTLKPDSKPTLDEIAKLMHKPDLKLKIVGHTDNQGTAEYNLDLSQRRAPTWSPHLRVSTASPPTGFHPRAPASVSQSLQMIPRRGGRRTAVSSSSRSDLAPFFRLPPSEAGWSPRFHTDRSACLRVRFWH